MHNTVNIYFTIHFSIASWLAFDGLYEFCWCPYSAFFCASRRIRLQLQPINRISFQCFCIDVIKVRFAQFKTDNFAVPAIDLTQISLPSKHRTWCCTAWKWHILQLCVDFHWMSFVKSWFELLLSLHRNECMEMSSFLMQHTMLRFYFSFCFFENPKQVYLT